ncbi:MAG: hypothetical protein ACI4L6_03655 [Candidatus Onthoplasma sp.]
MKISSIFDCIKLKKGYFIILLLLTGVAIALAVFGAMSINGGSITLSLGNMVYIKYLNGSSGMMSMLFRLIFSLSLFFFFVFIGHWKFYLYPVGILFYLYLVYSQAVVFISIILVYGFFNCIILAVFLLLYLLFLFFIFILMMLEMSCCTNQNYFKSCFSWKRSKLLLCICILIVWSILFAVILSILKSFVILLVY